MLAAAVLSIGHARVTPMPPGALSGQRYGWLSPKCSIVTRSPSRRKSRGLRASAAGRAARRTRVGSMAVSILASGRDADEQKEEGPRRSSEEPREAAAA